MVDPICAARRFEASGAVWRQPLGICTHCAVTCSLQVGPEQCGSRGLEHHGQQCVGEALFVPASKMRRNCTKSKLEAAQRTVGLPHVWDRIATLPSGGVVCRQHQKRSYSWSSR